MSADGGDDILAIDVSTEDYASAAAADQEVPEDVGMNPRTLQTEEDFQAQKASYSAKIDAAQACTYNKKRKKEKIETTTDAVLFAPAQIYTHLQTFDPPFPPPSTTTTAPAPSSSVDAPRSSLDKKQFQLVAAAVAELYFRRDYARVVAIADWAEASFALDPKPRALVLKWRERAVDKMGRDS
ncbi:hypothetical protein MBLNU459_g6181t2 [Dothideomycetes sp. NU459]